MESDPLCTPPQSHLLSNVYSTTPTCFWLVLVCTIINRRPSKARCILFLLFFVSLNLTHQGIENTSSHTLYHPRTSFPTLILPLTSTISWLLGIFINQRPLKAKAMPITLFLMGYASAPQTKEQAAASANPPPGACNGLRVSHCALIWGHGGCCHGKRWQSRWRVGRWWLMLVAVCFVFFVSCVLCCVWAAF